MQTEIEERKKAAAPGKPTELNPRANGSSHLNGLEQLLQALPTAAVERIYRLAWWELLDRELRPVEGEPWWNPDTEEWIGCDFYFDGCSCPKCKEAERRNRVLRERMI